MSKMCDICPRRDAANLQRSLAALNRSLGSTDAAVECDAMAARIETEGCPWWWGRTEENKDTGDSRVVYVCGIGYLPAFFLTQGNLVQEALETAQSRRNQQAVDMDRLIVTTSNVVRVIAAGMPLERVPGMMPVDRLITVTEEGGE